MQTPTDDGPLVLRHRFVPPVDPAGIGEAWRAVLAPVFEVAFRDETDLSAPIGLTSYHLGDLIVGDVAAPAHTLERPERMIRQQGIDHVLLQFYRSGHSRVETAHATTAVGETDCVVFDLAQPVRIVAAPVEATNLLLPRHLLESQGCRVDALHGRAFDHDADPAARLFHNFLLSLVACGDRLALRHAADTARAIVSLCATCLRGRDGGPGAGAFETRIAVRRFIQRELASPSLGAEVVAAQFGLSRSTLYRLFEEDGGVQSYIRDRRLMRAMKLLVQAGAAGSPRISGIAYAVGFTDDSTFSRAFKRRFGFAPSDLAAGRDPWPDGAREISLLLDWIRNLDA
ncbi:helix-turn-helix domain-containing protein [uncultured Methylobacterium sp.]|jgi:AraC-like DNA-binding protein|uniref:helix-turn-helix domain-containing protein n=1 Tax=uncultured Methylobacterium sp. TaxID=157278 RepID=UPI002632F6F1|nr:helix-turn-helix domain-containing protein [uncultured Methylobacterium sp.]